MLAARLTAETHCPKLQPSGWSIERLQRRSEEEGRARLSLTEGSDLFCFAAGWRPPTRRSAGLMLSLRSHEPLSSLSLSFSLSLFFSQPWRKTKDAVRQIEPVEEEGWRKGAGSERDGSTRGDAPGAAQQTPGPSAHGPSRMRERGRQLRYYAHGIILSPYRPRRTRRGTIAWPKSRNSERAPRALWGTICLMEPRV